MRARLKRCCPHLANASAAVLLDEITANVESAELVHTFDHSLDVAATVEIALPGRGSFTVSLWDTAGQEDYQSRPRGNEVAPSTRV